MPSLEEVKQQVGKLDGASKFLGRKEIRELPNILWEDESVERVVQGTYNSGNGVLVATNKRLVFVDKGMMSLKVEDFPYDKLTSIQYETGWTMGSLTIFASGNRAEIKNVRKDQVRSFAEAVRNRITSTSEPGAQPSAAFDGHGSVVDQLERLVKLKEQGILSEEEFQAQKAKLLG